jgi:hypothetical protein
MRTGRRLLRQEEGAVAIVVGITAIVLMAMTAVAVDGGRLFVERSSVQNAADHAALAAAWEYCTGGDEAAAIEAGRESAKSNGMDHMSSDVEVEIEALDEIEPLDELTRWSATVGSQIDAPFGAVVGKATMATTGEAVAGCTPGVEASTSTTTDNVTVKHNYAIFAGGSCSEKTVDGSGSNITINGDIHSNKDIDWGGSGNVVNGQGTYLSGVNASLLGKVTWNPSADNPKVVSATRPYPVSYNFDDYKPTGAIAVEAAADGRYFSKSGDWDLKKPIAPGIYYTPGDIKIGEGNVTADVTLVAGGMIDFSGSDQTLRPAHGDLLAFSNSNKGCNNLGVKMAGSNNDWQGTVFAPNSMIEYSGSTNSSVTGSLIGLHVRLNGSNTVINYGGGTTTTTVTNTTEVEGTDPVVDLLE